MDRTAGLTWVWTSALATGVVAASAAMTASDPRPEAGMADATPHGGAESVRPQPITEVELGRLLFWDPILSGDQDVACATCHHPDFAYADGRPISLGPGSVGLGPDRRDTTGGVVPPVRRNAPTVLNTVFNGLDRRRRGRGSDPATPGPVSRQRAPMFWDNRTRSLEAQALEPLKVFEEMRGHAYPEQVAVDSAMARLRSFPEYVAMFEEVYGPGTRIGPVEYGAAVAAFQRSLVAMNSRFDRFRAGDSTAMTPAQIRGMEAFEDADCDDCHEGIMFSDFDLHAEGVAERPFIAEPDTGDGRFRFRTPSLRNVALTAPYMHNGTIKSLDDVLRFYDEGASRNPNVVPRRRRRGGRDGGRDGLGTLDRDFTGVDDMSETEMLGIVAFLQALTDWDFDRRVPARVPSGLTPGGAIGGR